VCCPFPRIVFSAGMLGREGARIALEIAEDEDRKTDGGSPELGVCGLTSLFGVCPAGRTGTGGEKGEGKKWRRLCRGRLGGGWGDSSRETCAVGRWSG